VRRYGDQWRAGMMQEAATAYARDRALLMHAAYISGDPELEPPVRQHRRQ